MGFNSAFKGLILTHTEYKKEGCKISVCKFEGRDDVLPGRK